MMWNQLVLFVILASCFILVTEAASRDNKRKQRKRKTNPETNVTPPMDSSDATPGNVPPSQDENSEGTGGRNWGHVWVKNRYGTDVNGSSKKGFDEKDFDSVLKQIFDKMNKEKKESVKYSGFSGYLKGLKEKKVEGNKICDAHSKDIETCCASPKLITDQNIMQTCIRKHSTRTENNNGHAAAGENKLQNQIDKVRCSMQCAFEAHGYLDSNGTILKDKVISALKYYATNDFWLKYVPEAVEDCSKRLNAKKQKASTGIEFKCPPDTKQFQMCIRQRFFVNCPAENFAVDKSCKVLRKNMAACDPFSIVSMEKAKVNHPLNKLATNGGIKLSNRKVHQNKQVTTAPSDGQSRTTGNSKVPNIRQKAKRIKIVVKTTVAPSVKVSAKNKGNIKKISKKT